MEKTAKNLKITSICILIVTVLRLVFAIITLCIGLKTPEMEMLAGLTPEIVSVVVTLAWVGSVISIVPGIYLGLKGLKVAKNPDSSKAHLICAMVLIVFTALAILSVFNQNVNILEVVEVVAVGILYVLYYLEAKKLRVNA